MKLPPPARPHTGIEPLESRIAPALITLNIFDQSHTAVSVSSTKGTMAQLETAIGVTNGSTATGVLNFSIAGTGDAFKGADITITAGVPTGDALLTRIGFFDATGVDLGKVTIDGELDRINAGDNNSATVALKLLDVGTWGRDALPATVGEFDSDVVGSVTSLVVHGDFTGGLLHVRGSDSNDPAPSLHLTDGHGKIGTLNIAGSLVGTARENGGFIWATGDIKSITVGDSIRGFIANPSPQQPPTDQDFNGRIFSGGAIKTLVVGSNAQGGSVIGGDGASSGQVAAAGIGTVTVNGDIKGGLGLESGAVGAAGKLGTVTVKNLVGGAGVRSGSLLSKSGITKVTADRIQGGDGFNSGAIGSDGAIGTVVVTGDITGGKGDSSGQVVSKTTIKSVTVKNLVGGGGFESGAIGSLKGLGTILVKGNIVAGGGQRSGLIATEQEVLGEAVLELSTSSANAPIGSVTVMGSIIGTPATGSGTPAAALAGFRAGGILSGGKLGPVVVGGDLIGGDNSQTGRIGSSKGITSVTIGGKIQGGSGTESGTIYAAETLGPVKIGNPDFQGSGEVGFFGSGIQGSGGTHSGAVLAGQLTKIEVYGEVRGGSGPQSGVIETFGSGAAGKMGPVSIRGDLTGGGGTGSGSLRTGSGDMGAVKILGSLRGGSGNESGKIASGGKLASLTIGTSAHSGSIIGGEGDYDTTGGEGGGPREFGQVFAAGTIGPVTVNGNVRADPTDSESGGGDYAAVISGASIASVKISGQVQGGYGASSAGILARSLNLGPVTVDSVVGGFGAGSGFISAEGNIASVKIANSLVGGFNHGGYVAAGGILRFFEATFVTDGSSSSAGGPSFTRPRISAGDMLTSVIINGSVFDADILAGYNTAGVAFNPDAQIGTVKIGASDSHSETESGGLMVGTNIVAGISAGMDGFFGTSDDVAISGENKPVNSKIASVIVKGSILNTSNSGDHFGIIAEKLVSLKVGSSVLPLTSDALNDEYAPTGSSSDTVFGEKPAPVGA